MDSIQLSVRGMMEDRIELSLGDHPKLTVTLAYQKAVVDPDPGAVKEVLKAVEVLRLPGAPVDSEDGLDGFTFTLRFVRQRASSEYTWWSDPPAGWEPLASVATQLIAMTGRYIPSVSY